MFGPQYVRKKKNLKGSINFFIKKPLENTVCKKEICNFHLSLKIIIKNFGVAFVPHASSLHKFKKLALLEYKKSPKEKK
jgi:hypothetical protein